jgi:anti-sigma B factor antagonist
MALDRTGFSLMFSRALGNVIVHIHGALDATTAPELKDRLVDLIDGQGNRQLVLDLRRTTKIDSNGFSVLVDALHRQRKRGGVLVVSGPTSDVAEAFVAAGLEKIFVITPAWTHPAHGSASAEVRPLGRGG